MKSIIRLSVLLLITGFAACKKVENKVYFEGGTAPVLTASTAAVILEPGSENNTAITFNWTNPDYKFTTGISSQDVNYTIEIDTLGTNFTSKNKFITVVAKDLRKSYTVAQLNDIMGNSLLIPVGLDIPRRTITFQVRVTSAIGGAVKLVSNVVSFTARPFAPPPKVTPPSNSSLWITGSATTADWMCGCPSDQTSPALTTQRFTRQSATLYVLERVRLIGGRDFLLVPRYGSWSSVSPDPEKYGSVKGTNDMNPFGDEFRPGGNDHKAPPETGDYRIEVNFQTGRTTLIKL